MQNQNTLDPPRNKRHWGPRKENPGLGVRNEQRYQAFSWLSSDPRTWGGKNLRKGEKKEEKRREECPHPKIEQGTPQQTIIGSVGKDQGRKRVQKKKVGGNA